jgi:hypothetical protein
MMLDRSPLDELRTWYEGLDSDSQCSLALQILAMAPDMNALTPSEILDLKGAFVRWPTRPVSDEFKVLGKILFTRAAIDHELERLATPDGRARYRDRMERVHAHLESSGREAMAADFRERLADAGDRQRGWDNVAASWLKLRVTKLSDESLERLPL